MNPDFRKPVVEAIAKRAAYRCSNPDCDKGTLGPGSEKGQTLLIGEAAHIYGAQPRSARYRKEMDDVSRSDIANAIWLCRDCHALIDRDATRFPPDLLFAWKEGHENKILSELGKPGELVRLKISMRELEGFSHLPAYARELIREKGDLWEFKLTVELLDHYLAPVIRKSADFSRGLYSLPRVLLPPEQFTSWTQLKMHELMDVIDSLTGLFNGEIAASWGEPGQPGDAHEIDHACRLLGESAKRLLAIAEDITFTQAPDGFESAKAVLAEGAIHPLNKLPQLSEFIRSILSEEEPSGEYSFALVLDLPEDWAERFDRELEKGHQALQERGYVW